MKDITELFVQIVATFTDMAPYLLLGLTFAGILHVLFKKEFIIRHLGDNNLMSSVKAAIFGVPLPLCSCGVIPTALSLRKSKASEGATLSFLISTPQTGVDSIIATYGMLGPVFAVFRPLAALVMGIAGGIITSLFGLKASLKKESDNGTVNCTVCSDTEEHIHSLLDKIVAMIRYAYGSFLDDISVPLIVGIIISGMISYFIPDDFFTKYVGSGILGMLLMIIAGIPLYVCATASIPIAATLMIKGLSPGAAFVFLAVGPATNAAAIILITNVMGKRITAIYLSVISIGAIISGYALNYVYKSLSIDPILYAMKHHHENITITTIILSTVFLIMLILSMYRKFMPSFGEKGVKNMSYGDSNTQEPENKVVLINGMTCSHCVKHVTEAIESVSGVDSVSVDLKTKKAEIKGNFSIDDVRNAVKNAGYSPAD